MGEHSKNSNVWKTNTIIQLFPKQTCGTIIHRHRHKNLKGKGRGGGGGGGGLEH